MRVLLISAFLCLLTACGSSGPRAPAPDASCTILGMPDPQQTKLQDLQVTIEVRFINVSDDFFEQIGIDFDVVIEPENDPNPPSGGQLVSRPGYATPDGVVASTAGGDTIVPNGHKPGSPLPLGILGSVPGLDEGISFAQAPGLDFTCLDVYELLRFLLDDDAGLPAVTPIVPEGGITQGLGLAVEFLDEGLVQQALQLVENDQNSTVISAPQITVLDGQRAMVQSITVQVPATDLLDAVQNNVFGGETLKDAFSGITLDVVPVVSNDQTSVLLTVRPGAHGLFVTLPAPLTIGSNPVEIVVPAIKTTTVKTTVSVPDGGTVLMGGIKRLEDKGQTGVPLLSKIPYVNRLFKNTSIGRETSSLMMMVTPRIIIQEE